MKQTFGDFLRQERLNRMIKLNTFARMVGISSVYLSYIETGKRPAPSKPILEKIAKVLNFNHNEMHTMYNLASLSHTKQVLPNNLGGYIIERPYILETLLNAKEKNTSEAEWMEFNHKINLYSIIKKEK